MTYSGKKRQRKTNIVFCLKSKKKKKSFKKVPCSAWAAVKNNLRNRTIYCMANEILFSYSLGGWKIQGQGLEGSLSGKGSLPGLQMSTFCSLVSPLIETPIPSD